MTSFDAKWQRCVARARQAAPRDEKAPFGFATRMAARAFAGHAQSLESVWQTLALKLLAGALGALVLAAAIEAPHLRDTKPLEPGVADTVAQLVWRL
jgi:hypothetical protein